MLQNLITHYLMPLFKDITKGFLNVLFPITCVCCGIEGIFICVHCSKGLKRVSHQECIVCHKQNLFGITHSGCRKRYIPDGHLSFFDYHDKNVSKIIIIGKYSFLPGVFKQLGITISQILYNEYSFVCKNSFVTPVPLSKKRYRWRGFNQAQLLCESFSQQLGLDLCHALVRTKNTQTQKNLKRESRIVNVKDAFSFAASVKIKNKTILLVDDVATTGSTLLEAAKILKQNGAGIVWCISIAKD